MPRIAPLAVVLVVALASLPQPSAGAASPAPAAPVLSHPALRQDLPFPPRDPADQALHVDVRRGSDRNDGRRDTPVQTVQRAIALVQPGQTIYLRGGVYYENLYIARAGSEDKPITLASYPGEKAVLDGGIPEFFSDPAGSWQPYPEGAPGEFRSTRSYPHLHLPVACFGDSMIGLQTYYHAQDLRAQNHLVIYRDLQKRRETDHEPLYCGPGLWYDQATGYLHARLAHTDVPGIVNYRGATDPRQLPLVVAPFRSVPLTLDGARHVIVRDLVIRGGGYDTVKINLSRHITFERVTLWCGTYGILATGLQHFTLRDSGLYGSIAPWVYRSDGAKRDYPNQPHRNLTRLNAHALIVTDAGREWSVYATPVNDHWTLEHCHFADAHDAVYLGGINARFAFNLVQNMQDDGLYLSPMYPRHLYLKQGATLDIDSNVFERVNMPFAFGGFEDTRDTIHVHRNVVDNRLPMNMVRPTQGAAAPEVWCGMVMSDHGSPPWPTLNVYHNTFLCVTHQREAHMRVLTAVTNPATRRVFNNLFLHLGGAPVYPGVKVDPASGSQHDANLFWGPNLDAAKVAAYFEAYRQGELFKQSQQHYPPGFSTHSIAADPRLQKLGDGGWRGADYRPAPGSPALNAGVALPTDWPDPQRQLDADRPDLGAWPADAPPPVIGPRPVR